MRTIRKILVGVRDSRAIRQAKRRAGITAISRIRQHRRSLQLASGERVHRLLSI